MVSLDSVGCKMVYGSQPPPSLSLTDVILGVQIEMWHFVNVKLSPGRGTKEKCQRQIAHSD